MVGQVYIIKKERLLEDKSVNDWAKTVSERGYPNAWLGVAISSWKAVKENYSLN